MQLTNVKRIIVEDFPQEDRETVGKLASILNGFMDDLTELSRKRIDFDNLNRSFVQIDITVDANGIPKGLNQVNTNLSSFRGKNIVHVQSLAGGENVTSAPYLDGTYQGNGIFKITRFYGLPANKKLRIYLEFLG